MKALSDKYQFLIKWILIAAIILFVITICLLALMPPVARDVLIHHLAIPKIWIEHGGFYETPWAVYSYYPMNIDLLYAIPLYFGNDVIPAFIHLSFGLGTALLIFFYLRWRFNVLSGLLGFLIFISTPVVSKLSTMAYVDLGLVFFVTACALSFLQWRDGGYRQRQWLIISSIAMGLALGTKYNALVAWFFLTLAVVFIVNKESGRSGDALKSGFLFFMISVAVFSPWLIKNGILTGNPFYPLFPGVFEGNVPGSGNPSLVGPANAGLFRMREILYGESIWDVLTIPLRMFFQGQDGSPRYFDGVLNPLLILFVPFAFMKKTMKTENLFFMLFSFFFILVALFLDQIRIRYVLPVIPFLILLTVTGLMNIFEWFAAKKDLIRIIGISGVAVIVTVLVVLNALYLQKYFYKIEPIPYLTNKESRDHFIARHDASYPAVMFINKNTPADSRFRLILLAGRGYYLDRIYQEDRSFGMNVIHEMIDRADDEMAFQRYIESLECTHFLIRDALFQKYLRDNYTSEKIEQLIKNMNHVFKTDYNDGQYVVFSVIR